MSAPKLSRWELIQRMPVIRRVIRKAGQYACGICRQEFASYKEAYLCLDDCWHEVQNLSPVVIKNVMGVGPMYRCRFCSRDYNTASFARQCAAECKQKQALAHTQEANAIDTQMPRKKRAFLPKPVRNMPQPRYKQKRTKENNESQAELLLSKPISSADFEPLPETTASAPMNTDLSQPVATKAITTSAPKEIDASGRNKSSFKDQFYRNGAKYMCRFCNCEFFTKMEVEACFNDHFDANGYEKHI